MKFEYDYFDLQKYGAVTTLELGQLLELRAIDLHAVEWDAYSEEQHARLTNKIIDHYYYRSIGIIPIKRWLLAYKSKLNEIMPRYKPLYKYLESGADPLTANNRYGKSRQIFSDFPETMLGDNQDYASNGNDREFEEVELGDYLEKADKIANSYLDPDEAIIEELEGLFSSLLSVNVNV